MDHHSRSPEQQTGAEQLRNIGIVAHINAGKTTLTERVLFDTGRQRHLGDVDSGTATTDWRREEQERGISIEAAVTNVVWRGFRIQVVDTPGHVDFAAEVERTLRVLDGAIVVIDGVRGVEPQTEAVWRLLDRLQVPRLLFVNKLDRPTADFERALESVRTRLGAELVPAVVPIAGPDGALAGLIDAVGGRSMVWAGEAPSPELVEQAVAATLDRLGECDDELLAQFVESGGVVEQERHAAIRRATISRGLVPVFAGSALRNKGIEPLLDGVCRYLPSPLHRPLPEGAGDGALAFVFKHAVGPDGVHVWVRVFRGGLEVGGSYRVGGDREIRLRELASVHADTLEPVSVAGLGSIVAAVADQPLRTGATIRGDGQDLEFEPIRFSEPVLATRLEPRSAEELPELVERSAALAAADPTLVVRLDPSSGQLEVAGMGELHLDVFRARLERRLGRPVRATTPTVRLLGTVAASASGEAEVERSVGGCRLRARAEVSVEPAPGRGVVRRWAVSAGLGEEARAEVDRAVRGFTLPVAGGELEPGDLIFEVRSLEGEGDPTMLPALLGEAVVVALRRASLAAGPTQLEPWVRFLVEAPIDARSTVLADLRARSARVEEVQATLTEVQVRGVVPLRRILGYATPLRSMTRGGGTFEVQPIGYAAEA
jgi:elongation factor G